MRIILHCLVFYTYIQRNGWPEIHDFLLDDQPTVDFITSNELITQIVCK